MMRADAGSPEAARVIALSEEYSLAIRECRLIAQISLAEVNAILTLVEELGSKELHLAVLSRLKSLPDRVRLASCSGPSTARH